MVPDAGDFYDECEHKICLPGTSRMLNFVFTCYQSLFSVNYRLQMYNFKYCSQTLSMQKESQSCV